MAFFQKTAIAALFLSCLTVFPTRAMMNERRVWETIVLDGTIPFTEQVVRSGVCYEIRDTLDLGGKMVDMPDDCKLSFVGGMLSNGTINGNGCLIGNRGSEVIFGSQFTISDVSNREVSLGWFNLSEGQDVSGLVNGLVTNPAVEILDLAGKTVQMTYVDLGHSLSVNGSGATIVPILKTKNSYYGLFRCKDGVGEMTFLFRDFRVIGLDGVEYVNKVLGDRLFHFNNCDQVKFEHVVIGNMTGGHGSSEYGDDFNAGLIACFDVKELRIENCEFFNNNHYECICNMPIILNRKDINVVFNNNYFHDSNDGATLVYFLCNSLEMRRNVIRNCKYSGSLFNAHGYNSFFTDNDIRECVFSSVFDTCEYGKLEKTTLGEVVYYSDTVECSNNYCDCANGTLLVTWARVVLMKNNYLSGMCLCNAQGCEALGPNPDLDYVLPTNESVTIIGNTCIGDNVDKKMTLSFYHNFVRITSVYYFGGKALIEGNTFRRSEHIDDYPFSISNMKEIVINNNSILGCYLYDAQAGKYGLLKVGNAHSVYYPLDDIDVASIVISNNKVANQESQTELVVKVTERNQPYSINRIRTNNNHFGFSAKE